MNIKQHADITEKLFGYRAEDIHEWVDQFFNAKRFNRSARCRFKDGWNPFEHRQHLHNRESLSKAVEAFEGKYPEDIIEKVFLQHLKDDYFGVIPSRDDFNDPDFIGKYHR